MYESPIQLIEKDFQLQMEENICKAVKEVGISVNKEELVKALKYDREQYAKGFEDAIDAFINALLHGRDRAGVEILVFSEDAKQKLLKIAEQLKEK